MKNTDSIKHSLMIIVKETLKFTLISFAIIWIFGVLMLYLLVKILELSEEISVLITVATVVISILFLSEKILHTSDRINECTIEIVKVLIKNEKDR